MSHLAWEGGMSFLSTTLRILYNPLQKKKNHNASVFIAHVAR